jgi:cytochrome c oxidase subunit I
MAQTGHDASTFAPPLEVKEMELYHPKTFLGKYIWSQDAKVIAIRVSRYLLIYKS